jgi:hypothetical protein
MSLPPATSARIQGESPEPAVPETGVAPTSEVTPQMLLQILSTEHWSLLASRSMAWNESFTRTGMFLSTLSFAVVALALVGQASGFGDDFRLFALVILPIVLFVGIATSLRLDSANYHELLCTVGMNRIRARYLELAPGHDLERTFVMGTTDDERGIVLTMAAMPRRGWLTTVLATTPALIAVLNSALAAAIIGLLLFQLGADTGVALVVGAVAFVIAFVVQALSWRRQLAEIIAGYTPEYPGTEGARSGP